MSKQPFAFRMLRTFCPSHLAEEIEGDLLQKYERDLKKFSIQNSKRRLLWNTIRFFRLGILLRNKNSLNLFSTMLLFNYFKITLRNLNKRKTYSLVNILGLSVGMAACLVISQYVEFETNYERFHVNAKNIYRVVSSFYTDGTKESYSGYDLGPALQRDIPEVKTIARLHENSSVVSFRDKQDKEVRFYEERINAVDSTFLKIFTFRFVYGGPEALFNPYNIVLTKTVAAKYFGNENPVGAELTLHDNWPGVYTVSAVIEDLPANTHFSFDILMPLHNLLHSEFYKNQNARWDNFHTYVEVHEQSDIGRLESKLPAFIKRYRGEDKAINASPELQLQPLLDIHYSPDLARQGSHKTKIYFFVLIAGFILIMAWINYVNLATARAVERAREVGVKKALGVLRTQLISQFIVESVFVNFVSVALGVALAWLSMPLLNAITNQSFTLNFLQPNVWLLLGVLFSIGSLAAGFYPAFVLSSFKTTEVIKGKLGTATSGWPLRSTLVVFQFACSLLLIAGTIVIYKQVNYLKLQDKMMNTTQVIVMKGPETANHKGLANRMVTLKDELSKLTGVEEVATSYSVPAKDPSVSSGIRKLGLPLEENRIGHIYWVDPDFMPLYDIQLLAGKFWDERISSEMGQLIVNEEAVKKFQLGTNENAIGTKLITPFDTVSILGVVKNHHWRSLKEPHQPMIFRVEKVSATNVSMRLNGDLSQTIDHIKAKYLSAFPGEEFSYYFLDDYYAAQYTMEQQSGKLFSVLSILAIIISCLGLWALAAFTTLHRMKEISVRKVLGASAGTILSLLSQQFLKPLLIACIFGLPLAWMGMQQWLEQFPYRINLSIDLFLIPVLALTLLAMLTISVQTIRAAISNPIKFLRGE